MQPSIAVWGDSLALGLTNALQALYPTRATYMGGVGGQTSTQVAARMLADTSHRDWLTVIWAGRNNWTDPVTVKADIAAMVAALPHGHYVVVGIINGDYSSEYTGTPGLATIEALNSNLATTYGSRFVEARAPLIAAADPASAQDAIDVAHGVPPTSMRGTDPLHLNAAGQAVVAGRVKAVFDANGW